MVFHVATLEAELAEFKRALGLFYNDLQSESLDPPTQSMQWIKIQSLEHKALSQQH